MRPSRAIAMRRSGPIKLALKPRECTVYRLYNRRLYGSHGSSRSLTDDRAAPACSADTPTSALMTRICASSCARWWSTFIGFPGRIRVVVLRVVRIAHRPPVARTVPVIRAVHLPQQLCPPMLQPIMADHENGCKQQHHETHQHAYPAFVHLHLLPTPGDDLLVVRSGVSRIVRRSGYLACHSFTTSCWPIHAGFSTMSVVPVSWSSLRRLVRWPDRATGGSRNGHRRYIEAASGDLDRPPTGFLQDFIQLAGGGDREIERGHSGAGAHGRAFRDVLRQCPDPVAIRFPLRLREPHK